MGYPSIRRRCASLGIIYAGSIFERGYVCSAFNRDRNRPRQLYSVEDAQRYRERHLKTTLRENVTCLIRARNDRVVRFHAS